uniref:RNA-dependent RNA polymerase n=1 Tax=Panagrolaimus davidi TaxID=227884 RepID=A0A914P746_9BILA
MVYITPTRILLGLEEAVKDSRGIRMLKPENLIQVKFRDENFSTFPLECVEQIFLRCYLGGINIAGRQFHEFGGSSSLFREHGSYFYATNDKTDIIRWWQKLGQFKIEAPSKVGARIGQYFTSATQITMKVRQSNVQVFNDIMSNSKDSRGNSFCFSDGVGTISPDFAAQISQDLQLPYIPSAFQIRYAGCKGMVFIDKEDHCQDRQLFGNGGKYLLCFRKSQQKFIVENNDEYLDFDVVNFSTPTPANLFPVFTAMLDSLAYCGNTRKKLHERLRQLQYQRFLEIIKPLAINAQFIKTLKTLPQYFPISAIEDKFLIEEPFLRSMIEAKAVSNAKLMMSKCQLQLPMSLARAVFGIMDPTGILNHGEIFFKYSEPSSLNTKTVLIQEKVGITKGPIYHAGDIRFLRSVDIPALHHLSDVLVFPSRGFRPHPDEIGGGDLDGDTYIIFWDPDLIPNWEAPSADYTAPSVEHIEKVDLYNLQDKHPHFRVQYAKENNLEQISTCHLAHLVTHQPFHKDCTKIAKKGEIAVHRTTNFKKR